MLGFRILWRCFANGVSLSLMLKSAAVHDGAFDHTLKQGGGSAWCMWFGSCRLRKVAHMREAELWSRLGAALGGEYARSWASTVALQELESRTVDEALVAGVSCKEIWRAVWVALELPATMR